MKGWRRAHDNGWIVEVFESGGTTYSYRARAPGGMSRYVRLVESRLAWAQAAADNLVPYHVCTCPGWREVE